jgi:hypothetical protein
MSGVSMALKGGLAIASLSIMMALGTSLPASSADNATCGVIEKSLIERKSIIEKIEAYQKGKPKATPQEACAIFTKLVNNGAAGIKWLDTNKDWCAIPDTFAERYKQDHTKMVEVKGKTCSMAAKAATMQKQQSAKQENQLFGGPGLTGSFKLPQGAM